MLKKQQQASPFYLVSVTSMDDVLWMVFPPENVGGHGWPERSAHGCARSGFREGTPSMAPAPN